MTKKNPFPGMNPFIEQRWPDALTMLIGYIRDSLQEKLPEDLIAGAEEELVSIGDDDEQVKFRPDVSVRAPWESSDSTGSSLVAEPIRAPQATSPTCIVLDEKVERWIEVRDTNGRLITVIELFNPSNKEDETAREKYRRKRRTLITGRVNVVEIDLVRRGGSLFPEEVVDVKREKGASYGICVFRATRIGEREFYAVGLRQPLPIVSIPLRPGEPEVALELQALVDRCHERGRYHLLHYGRELDPPVPEKDRLWIEETLRQHELIR